ncbi:MAG: general secretion pathway protein D [Alphaproteobacteria bacterium]|jgi:general secretion pathway protein D
MPMALGDRINVLIIQHNGWGRARVASVYVPIALILSIFISACVPRMETSSLFEQLAYDPKQGKQPQQSGTRKTEHPKTGSWGPRAKEYHGDDRATAEVASGFGARRSGKDFEINFRNADLAEVIKVILRDTLQISYVLDPNVKGTVTVSTAQSISRTELLRVLESVLGMNRAAMIKTSNGYKIVPSATMRTGGGDVSYASERSQLGPGYGISILPLRHVSASEILKLLTSFVSRPQTLRADANRNVLLIRGTGSDRATLLDVAATFDVDWLRGQSAGIYRLFYATPDEMIQELTRIFRTGQGAIGEDLIRFEPIKRLNAVLVLTKRQKLLSKAATWIKRLDKTDSLSEAVYVYRVEHTKAARLAIVLNKMFGGRVDAATPAEVAPKERASVTVGSELANPVSTGSTTLLPSQADVGNSAQSTTQHSGGQRSGGKVQIIADESQNKLLISASLRDYKKIIGVLERLDRPAAQVLIKATLAEVLLNKNLRYGVQAFLQNASGASQGVLGFSNGESLVIQPSLPGLNFLVGLPATPKIILDALSNQTSVRLVSSPSLVVVNNETAVLQVGDDVPIATRQAQSITDPAAPIVNNIEFRKTGVILKVTPRINSDGLVTIKVEQEISSVVAPQAGAQGTTLTPTISQRRIASTISVYSGQMVVLGGLVTERTSKFANRVPILEHIPIAGDLVGKTDDAGQRTELVIFIQPQVIRDASDATRIADELRARMGALAPDDRRRRRMLRFKKRRNSLR